MYKVLGDCARDKVDDGLGACEDDDWGGERGGRPVAFMDEDSFDGDGSEVGVGEIPILARRELREDVSPSC